MKLLETIEIAKPCPASWEDMSGDARVRHCGQCELNVYDVSEMTHEDAEALIRAHEGERVCLRLHKRADGTVITQDCPVGLAAFKRRVRAVLVGLAAALLGLLSLVGLKVREEGLSEFLPVIVEPEPEYILMGDVCPPPPPPAPPQGS